MCSRHFIIIVDALISKWRVACGGSEKSMAFSATYYVNKQPTDNKNLEPSDTSRQPYDFTSNRKHIVLS